MITGEKGDVFASTFLPQQRVVLLAKNGDPSKEDLRQGAALIHLLRNSERMRDILPFIAERGAEGVQKRLAKFYGLMKASKDTLTYEVQNYTIGEEFFSHLRKGSGKETSSAIVKRILGTIIETCAKERTFSKDTSSHEAFVFLVSAVVALGNSKFFKYFTKKKSVDKLGDTKLSEFWRNLDKIRQYICINDAIQYVRTQGPFKVQ
ncbi:hypothetical protein C0995_007935 [Termitomyces sp. Mi166|nr:hypothetical protein C0995_007935 [Termitomyces sp. Mi166\